MSWRHLAWVMSVTAPGSQLEHAINRLSISSCSDVGIRGSHRLVQVVTDPDDALTGRTPWSLVSRESAG